MVDSKCRGVDFSIQQENRGWEYCPSFPAAVLFTVLYFLLSVIHGVQGFIFRKVYSPDTITRLIFPYTRKVIRSNMIFKQ